jgi:hypothetical protein
MAEGEANHTAEQEEEPDKRAPWWKRLWEWTELGKKSGWDLLQLLIVPLALAVIGFWFTAQQDARQQEIENQRADAERALADERAQDEALQAYLDQMGNLLLEKDLRASDEYIERDLSTSDQDSEERTLARARTLTVLGRLDPSRKTAVIQFLVEAKLIQVQNPEYDGLLMVGGQMYRGEGREPVIRLSGADLSGAEGITNEELDQQAASLKGTTMPDGQMYEDWLKSKGRGDGEHSGPS